MDTGAAAVAASTAVIILTFALGFAVSKAIRIEYVY